MTDGGDGMPGFGPDRYRRAGDRGAHPLSNAPLQGREHHPRHISVRHPRHIEMIAGVVVDMGRARVLARARWLGVQAGVRSARG